MIPAHGHEFRVDIDDADIDFMGHVNNAVYLKWVQSAVIEHWRRVAPPDAVAAYLWIALKHEITYRQPAFLHDRLVASVILESVRRESAFYETKIRRGDEVIAEVRSRWCCVDAAARNPARVTDEIVRCFFPHSAPSGDAPIADAAV